MFFKKGVLKNFTNFTGLKACNFTKKRLEHRCFPVKIAKFLRTPFFTELLLPWLLLEGVFERTSFVKILQPCHFNIFEINHRCFRKMFIKKYNEEPRLWKCVSTFWSALLVYKDLFLGR